MITQEELHELFKLREDNRLIWKIQTTNKIKIGDVAGCLHPNGYRYIQIYGKNYSEHRLIWIYHNGDIPDGLFIDHINGIRDDNRVENLRLVTKQENAFNQPGKGYSWNKINKNWVARISINNKLKHLGSFKNEEDARQAYLDAKEIYHIISDRKS